MSENKMTVPFFKASIGKEEEDAAVRVLRSGWLTTGNEAHEFEKEFSEYAELYDNLGLSYEGSSPYTLVTKNGEVVGEHVEGYMEENETNSFLSELGF